MEDDTKSDGISPVDESEKEMKSNEKSLTDESESENEMEDNENSSWRG